jgi:lysozyme
MQSGIDISHNNGVIDWKQLISNIPSVEFVYIKATQGTGFIDPQLKVNAASCDELKLSFGYYHFASQKSDNVIQDAQNEATFFLSVLSKLPVSKLPLALDIETNKAGLSSTDIAAWITTFFGVLRDKGYSDYILYSYPDFLNSNLPAKHNLGNVRLWLSHFTKHAQPSIPKGWKDYTVWQYGQGHVMGIKGLCDLNRSMG